MVNTQFVGGGRFEVLKSIGAGNFGQTYLAKDSQQFDNLCVLKRLKTLTSQPQVLEIARVLFEKEAKILHQLGHQHDRIPYLLAYFQEDKDFYLVEEFIPGHDLSKELLIARQFSAIEVLTLLKDILEPLAFLHQQQVIHRDIKPSNLMRRDCDGKIVLIDFGAIKQLAITELNSNSPPRSIGTIIGTPGYMPGEQSRGRAKLASDVYAVGMVAIQALSGVFPLNFTEDKSTGEPIWQPQVSFLPDALRIVLEKMVACHLKDRYPTASQALEAVSAIDPHSLTPSLSNFTEIPPTKKYSVLSEFSRNLSYNKFSTFIDAADSKNVIESFDDNTFLEENLAKQIQIHKIQLNTFNFEAIAVDRFGKQVQLNKCQAQSFSQDLGDNVTLDLVAISGGTLIIQNDRESADINDNSNNSSQITIEPFFIGKFLITQAQWRAIATKTGKIDRDLNEDPAYFKGDNRPIEKVCWYEAREFCQRLSQKTGLVYRLPTVAEWEYACRANTNKPFSYGETLRWDLANYDARYTYAEEPAGKYRAMTVDVGNFPPNAFGLYDMHGQVWEWCYDLNSQNDLNSNNEEISVLRGGSWHNKPEDCLCSLGYYVGEKRLISKFIGFRVICQYPEQK